MPSGCAWRGGVLIFGLQNGGRDIFVSENLFLSLVGTPEAAASGGFRVRFLRSSAVCGALPLTLLAYEDRGLCFCYPLLSVLLLFVQFASRGRCE